MYSIQIIAIFTETCQYLLAKQPLKANIYPFMNQVLIPHAFSPNIFLNGQDLLLL